MTRKARREARQDSKIARSMEKKLLRGSFKQELKELRFEDVSFNGSVRRLMEDLADKECLGFVVGENLGLPRREVGKLIAAHEESIAYTREHPRGPNPQLVRAAILRTPR